MQKYKIGLLIPTFLPFATTIACNAVAKNQNLNSWWDRNITISVAPGWAWSDKPTAFARAARLLAKKINDLKNGETIDKYSYKGLGDVNVAFDYSASDNDARLQSVISKKHDLAFASIAATMSVDQAKIFPLIQTKTNAFTFDRTWKTYNQKKEPPGQSLAAIAAAQTTAYQTKYNRNNESWNGKVYTNFYNVNHKVDFYRGMIWVYGEKKAQAQRAWRNKNWADFVDAGIIHGGVKSGGKFKLQEALFKKHFGASAFSSLAEEMKRNPTRFKKGTAKDMGRPEFAKYSIVFDDEGSFAWTKKENEDGSENFPTSSAEVLTVTDPLKYDIGSFRTNMDPRQARLVALAFKLLVAAAEEKRGPAKTKALDEIYGPSYGYNDYGLISDRTAELEQPYNEVMGLK